MLTKLYGNSVPAAAYSTTFLLYFYSGRSFTEIALRQSSRQLRALRLFWRLIQNGVESKGALT